MIPIVDNGEEPKPNFENENDDPEWDEMDDDDFQECDECDGHDACRDFGCAFKHGLGHLVQPPL